MRDWVGCSLLEIWYVIGPNKPVFHLPYLSSPKLRSPANTPGGPLQRYPDLGRNRI